MGALTVREVRQRVATALEAVSGWSESPFAAELYGRESKSLQHRSFAVYTPESGLPPEAGRRQLAAQLANTSNVEVRWSWRLTVGDQVASYDAALDAEATLRDTVLGVSQADLHLLWQTSRREVRADGVVVFGVMVFDARHRF